MEECKKLKKRRFTRGAKDVEYRPSQPEKPCRVLSMRWVPEIESQGPSGEGCSNRLVIVGSSSSERSWKAPTSTTSTLVPFSTFGAF